MPASRLALFAALAATTVAHADPLRPVTDHLGWSVDLDTFVQVDAIPWNQASQDEISPSTGASENLETVMVRRALFRVEGKHDDFRAGAEVDADTVAGPAARLLTAHVGWVLPSPDASIAPPLVAVDAGLMQIPFGAATPLNVRYRYFMEQPTFLRALFPGDDDAGVIAHGAYGVARWSVAAMNGAPVKDAQWKGVDPSASYDFIARLGGDISILTIPGRPRVSFGASALTGDGLHPGTPPTKDTLQWVDANHNGIVDPTELTIIPGRPAIPSQSFHHAAVGADAKLQWCLQWAGEGEAFFEGAIATNLDRGVVYADPIDASRTIRELGYQVGVVQHLTRNAFAGVRYDYYNADRDAAQQTGVTFVDVDRVFSTWAFLAAAQWDTWRLSVEYDHVRNPLGLSDTGTPTTRAADQIVVRAQAEL